MFGRRRLNRVVRVATLPPKNFTMENLNKNRRTCIADLGGLGLGGKPQAEHYLCTIGTGNRCIHRWSWSTARTDSVVLLTQRHPAAHDSCRSTRVRVARVGFHGRIGWRTRFRSGQGIRIQLARSRESRCRAVGSRGKAATVECCQQQLIRLFVAGENVSAISSFVFHWDSPLDSRSSR